MLQEQLLVLLDLLRGFTGCWLQYHDKETGNLLGTLLLAIGTRVALTDHTANKSLLAGQVGCIPGGGARRSRGLQHLPHRAKRADWYLDKNRGEKKRKLLKVHRT